MIEQVIDQHATAAGEFAPKFATLELIDKLFDPVITKCNLGFLPTAQKQEFKRAGYFVLLRMLCTDCAAITQFAHHKSRAMGIPVDHHFPVLELMKLFRDFPLGLTAHQGIAKRLLDHYMMQVLWLYGPARSKTTKSAEKTLDLMVKQCFKFIRANRICMFKGSLDEYYFHCDDETYKRMTISIDL